MEYIPTRMQIKLTPDESQLLARIAREQKRDPREQAAFFVRQALGMNEQTLSPLSLAALIQVAKDEGLDNMDEAVRMLVTERMVTQNEAVGALLRIAEPEQQKALLEALGIEDVEQFAADILASAGVTLMERTRRVVEIDRTAARAALIELAEVA